MSLHKLLMEHLDVFQETLLGSKRGSSVSKRCLVRLTRNLLVYRLFRCSERTAQYIRNSLAARAYYCQLLETSQRVLQKALGALAAGSPGFVVETPPEGHFQTCWGNSTSLTGLQCVML